MRVYVMILWCFRDMHAQSRPALPHLLEKRLPSCYSYGPSFEVRPVVSISPFVVIFTFIESSFNTSRWAEMASSPMR